MCQTIVILSIIILRGHFGAIVMGIITIHTYKMHFRECENQEFCTNCTTLSSTKNQNYYGVILFRDALRFLPGNIQMQHYCITFHQTDHSLITQIILPYCGRKINTVRKVQGSEMLSKQRILIFLKHCSQYINHPNMIDVNMCLLCKCTLSGTFLTVIAFYYTAWHLNVLYRQFFLI